MAPSPLVESQITKAGFENVSCRVVDGVSVARYSPTLRCLGREHMVAVIPSIILLILMVIGVPVFSIVLYWR
jgi:hypothetical protein